MSASGAYRNMRKVTPYILSATGPIEICRRLAMVRDFPDCFPRGAPHAQEIDQHYEHDADHYDGRECRPKRPVSRLQKLPLNNIADQLNFRTTKEGWNNEIANRRDEYDYTSSQDTR